LSDLEGLARRLIQKEKSDEEIISRLVQEYQDFKDIDKNSAIRLSKAVLEECKNSGFSTISDNLIKSILKINEAKITVGNQGVGCRGAGDFFVHKLVADLSETRTKAYLSPRSLDDAGAIRVKDLKFGLNLPDNCADLIIVSKMEGIHSRLSDFPYICGFHVARAALRDLYVKGSIPISIMIDAHLGDDADVGKLFDFMAGVSTVSELAQVPITAGSTLRIGGDMVIGDRFVGGLAAIGIASKSILARRLIQPGDKILMTEGAGGGTITTTAIYSGNHEIVKETLNIKFLEAAKIILNSFYLSEIRAMCDVTNGGLRGDLYEINHEAGCGVIFYEEKVRELVNKKVLNLLESVNVDYLGVSLDALLIYCSQEVVDDIIQDLAKINIKCAEIGYVDDSETVSMISQDEKRNVLPRFRESAYTKIKQEIGESTPENIKQMERELEEAANKAIEKRKRMIDYINNN
jgi:hydrogenase expression/formation protein